MNSGFIRKNPDCWRNHTHLGCSCHWPPVLNSCNSQGSDSCFFSLSTRTRRALFAEFGRWCAKTMWGRRTARSSVSTLKYLRLYWNQLFLGLRHLCQSLSSFTHVAAKSLQDYLQRSRSRGKRSWVVDRLSSCSFEMYLLTFSGLLARS